MSTLEAWAEVLGWCTVINAGLLILGAIAVMLARGPLVRIHAKMFCINETDLPSLYFRYLGQYKIAILVLNLVPYIALKIVIGPLAG